MPSSQTSASERRNNDTSVSPDKVTLEPPKLKTTLKTPPKQATNPLQFVKVGPCSLYRTAQEQLQKVQEVKKIKQEIRDDPEDWQSNLDNWKSSRRKRQEHIIERVVEVKKLELEEHDRQRRRSKTFSEMMEERGNRGRKLSISLAMYSEEDANDLSDLGIGTSSGKSSVSGDTHDDTHSVLSDRDSEVEKNHSDIENVSHENGNNHSNDRSSDVDSSNTLSFPATTITTTSSPTASRMTVILSPRENKVPNNDFHKTDVTSNYNSRQEYDSGMISTTSLSEPEEYTYESAIRGYVSRVSQNIPRRSLTDPDMKFDNGNKVAAATVNNTANSLLEKPTVEDNHELKVNNATATPLVKVDILKRREIFEKALRENIENKNNNNNSSNNNNNNRLDFASTKSIKERLSSLERQNSEIEAVDKSPKHSIDSTISVRERFNRKKQSNEKEGNRDFVYEELEGVEPLRERLSKLEKITSNDQGLTALSTSIQQNGDFSTKTIKDRLTLIDADRCKEMESCSSSCFHKQQANIRVENSTSSERSSSPDSEYRASRATFHQSLDSLDADASSGPDTFERVQSLEELDYHEARRYPASSSSAEILNDTDREDSGIHTADVSCSVSQADEPIEEEIGTNNSNIIEKHQQHQVIIEEKTEFRSTIETTLVETLKSFENVEENNIGITIEPELCDAVKTEMGTAEISSSSSTSASEELLLSANSSKTESQGTNANTHFTHLSSSRPVIYQSPPVPPRISPPEDFLKSKLSSLPVPTESSEGVFVPDSSLTNAICSLNFFLEQGGKNSQSKTPNHVSFDPSNPKHPQFNLSPLLPSLRSPSKIPTPCLRKIITNPKTDSPSCIICPTSPTRASPGSPKHLPLLSPKLKNPTPRFQMSVPSEIPIPIKITSPPSPNPSIRPTVVSSEEAQQRPVVEVCEKVAVSRGQAQVTPFITLERYSDEVSGSTEIRVDERLSTAIKKS